VFARLSPAQKNRVILALKQRSHVVGYLGYTLIASRRWPGIFRISRMFREHVER
jgi:hypothetical protein